MHRIVGYTFQVSTDIAKLDVTKITHLNYSFGLIHNREYEQKKPTGELFGTPPNPDVRTPEPVPEGKLHTIYLADKVKADLSRLCELRAKNPDLKILLSIGGWDARGFCDAAGTKETRETFATSCKEVLDKYLLDGIDLDWEYPVDGGSSSIKASLEDKTNFTLLLQAVREKIGSEALLTIAGAASPLFTTEWTEFKKVVDLLDFVNIMTYDFQYSTYFGSALFPSKTYFTGHDPNCKDAVEDYLAKGCPPEKLNLGLAFAATIPPLVRSSTTWPLLRDRLEQAGFFQALPHLLRAKKLKEHPLFEERWDEDAKNMYVVTTLENGEEQFVLGYIEPRSIAEKLKWQKSKGLGGVMFWEFGADYDNSLVAQLHRELLEETPK